MLATLVCGLAATPASAAANPIMRTSPGMTVHHPVKPHMVPHATNHAAGVHHNTANTNNTNTSAVVTTPRPSSHPAHHQRRPRLRWPPREGRRTRWPRDSRIGSSTQRERCKRTQTVWDQRRAGADRRPGWPGGQKLFGINVNKGAGGNRVPQAQSDAELKQAMTLLAGLNGHVPNTQSRVARPGAITKSHRAEIK